MINKFKIGSDPEFFVVDNYNNPYPAIDLVPGDKQNPFKISDKGHAVQVDNVMLEANIPPGNDYQQFWNDIQFVLDWFKNKLTPNYRPEIKASMEFDPKHLTSDKAKEFGCDPDFDVWRENINEAPNGETNLRSCGKNVCRLK